MPYAQDFVTSPSVPDMCAMYSAADIPLVMFIPLQSKGGVLSPYNPVCNAGSASSASHLGAFSQDRLLHYFSRLCARNSIVGIFVGVSNVAVLKYHDLCCNTYFLSF